MRADERNKGNGSAGGAGYCDAYVNDSLTHMKVLCRAGAQNYVIIWYYVDKCLLIICLFKD